MNCFGYVLACGATVVPCVVKWSRLASYNCTMTVVNLATRRIATGAVVIVRQRVYVTAWRATLVSEGVSLEKSLMAGVSYLAWLEIQSPVLRSWFPVSRVQLNCA